MVIIKKRFVLPAVLVPFLMSACAQKREPVVINVNPAPVVSEKKPEASQEQQGTARVEAARPATGPANVNVGWQRQAPAPPPTQVVTSPPPPPQPVVTQVVQRIDEASFFNTQVHGLAVQLLKNFRGDIGPEGPIAVATFVDLNDLYRTSPLGRYLAEQLMGELQRAGFTVVDVRKTNSMLMKQKYGEYSLSRSVEEIAKETSARYILVGTYVVRDKFVLINARLVSNDNNIILSSGMKIMRRDPFIERMLWPSAAPPKEPAIKLPVKGFGEPTEVRLISGS